MLGRAVNKRLICALFFVSADRIAAVTKPLLKSATALAAILAMTCAGHALAAKPQPKSKPVSPAFKAASGKVARQTVVVVQAGSPGVAAAPSGQVGEADLPAITDAPAPAADVACNPSDKSDTAWKQVPQDLRDQARPGQCFARMLIAPKFETYQDHVLVAEARSETHTTPEVAQMVVRDVVVVPEHIEHHQFAEVSHVEMATEIVSPPTTREEVIPARYEIRSQRVMVTPEHQEWVRQDGIATGAALVTPDDHVAVRYRADGLLTWPGKDGQRVRTSAETADYLRQGSGQTIWCLKVIPAVYDDQQARVEVEPEHTRTIDVPAVTRSVRRVVIDTPAHIEDSVVPAVTEKRKVREIVTPAHTETVQIPAVYQDVARQRVIKDAEPVWREVLCDRNASPQVVTAIQHALAAHGYNPGKIDGQLGTQTVSAMQKFEADRGLPQGQVSVEAVNALGVQLN